MTPDHLRHVIAQLGTNQTELGKFLGHPDGRTVRRWLAGESSIPVAVAKLLAVMQRKEISMKEVDWPD